MPPGVLEDQAANWITSVHLDKEQRQQLDKLVRKFSNITLIDIETIMQRVRGIIDRVSMPSVGIYSRGRVDRCGDTDPAIRQCAQSLCALTPEVTDKLKVHIQAYLFLYNK